MALTGNQIIALATQAINVPGFTSQAQQLLVTLLEDLADTQDLDLCRGLNQSITLNSGATGSGPYLLPLDYRRAVKDGVWYVYNGVPYKLINITLEEYYAQVQQAGISNFPIFFATDISPLAATPPTQPLLYVWPPSSISTTLFVDYRRIIADITDLTTVPWFPNQTYLLLQLKGELADLAGDTRAAGFKAEALQHLERYLKLTNDDEGRALNVSLDRRRFGSSWNNLPNTKGLGW